MAGRPDPPVPLFPPCSAWRKRRSIRPWACAVRSECSRAVVTCGASAAGCRRAFRALSGESSGDGAAAGPIGRRRANKTGSVQRARPNQMKPRIAVIGVGGAGGNAVNNMIAAGLSGVDFIVANTDAQALEASTAAGRVQLGASLTEGLGAGSKPEIGEAAAEEAVEEIRASLTGSHMA